MADVDEIRLVIGGNSFRTSLGSSGVKMANYIMSEILLIQDDR